jgi:hypothetical protein
MLFITIFGFELENVQGVNAFQWLEWTEAKFIFIAFNNLSTHKQGRSTNSTRKSAFTKIHN